MMRIRLLSLLWVVCGLMPLPLGEGENKTPHLTVRGSSYLMPGSSLLTWGDPTLPSALRRFTSEFGMGSGGTTALQPPQIPVLCPVSFG